MVSRWIRHTALALAALAALAGAPEAHAGVHAAVTVYTARPAAPPVVVRPHRPAVGAWTWVEGQWIWTTTARGSGWIWQAGYWAPVHAVAPVAPRTVVVTHHAPRVVYRPAVRPAAPAVVYHRPAPAVVHRPAVVTVAPRPAHVVTHHTARPPAVVHTAPARPAAAPAPGRPGAPRGAGPARPR
jgi:hypothetical protein